jgi:hypothetical protein
MDQIRHLEFNLDVRREPVIRARQQIIDFYVERWFDSSRDNGSLREFLAQIGRDTRDGSIKASVRYEIKRKEGSNA